MFKKGDIVYHENIVFSNGMIDNKKKRPCLVLFIVEIEEEQIICTVPLTSQVKSLNKRPNDYYLMPEIIYNYTKLSIANIKETNFHQLEDTYDTGLSLGEETTNAIINKIKKSKSPKLKNVNKFLSYIELFNVLDKKEEKKSSKQLRNMRRRELKKIAQ